MGEYVLEKPSNDTHRARFVGMVKTRNFYKPIGTRRGVKFPLHKSIARRGRTAKSFISV